VDLRGADREAAWLRGLVSVYPERMDTWLDEDEEVTGLRDPYHRVDARRSSRRIEVRADGEVLARSERPVVVAETGLPLRFYLRARTSFAELRPSDRRRPAPTRGARRTRRSTASRTSPGPTTSRWRACSPARDMLCFDASKVEVSELAVA
jgi:hypothetical protein